MKVPQNLAWAGAQYLQGTMDEPDESDAIEQESQVITPLPDSYALDAQSEVLSKLDGKFDTAKQYQFFEEMNQIAPTDEESDEEINRILGNTYFQQANYAKKQFLYDLARQRDEDPAKLRKLSVDAEFAKFKLDAAESHRSKNREKFHNFLKSKGASPEDADPEELQDLAQQFYFLSKDRAIDENGLPIRDSKLQRVAQVPLEMTGKTVGSIARGLSKLGIIDENVSDSIYTRMTEDAAMREARRKQESSGKAMGYVEGTVGSVWNYASKSFIGGAPLVIGGTAYEAGMEADYQAKVAGLSPSERIKFATRAAVIEGAVTMIFQRAFGGKFAGIEGGARMNWSGLIPALRHLGGELVEEEIIEVLNATNEALSGVDPDSFSWDRFIDTAVITTGSVGMIGGGIRLFKHFSPTERMAREAVKRHKLMQAIEEGEQLLSETLPKNEEGGLSRAGYEAVVEPDGKKRTTQAERDQVLDEIRRAEREHEAEKKNSPPVPEKIIQQAKKRMTDEEMAEIKAREQAEANRAVNEKRKAEVDEADMMPPEQREEQIEETTQQEETPQEEPIDPTVEEEPAAPEPEVQQPTPQEPIPEEQEQELAETKERSRKARKRLSYLRRKNPELAGTVEKFLDTRGDATDLAQMWDMIDEDVAIVNENAEKPVSAYGETRILAALQLLQDAKQTIQEKRPELQGKPLREVSTDDVPIEEMEGWNNQWEQEAEAGLHFARDEGQREAAEAFEQRRNEPEETGWMQTLHQKMRDGASPVEAWELARELDTGLRVKAIKNALGAFDPRAREILINPKAAGHETTLAFTLLHEIGHLTTYTDYDPHRPDSVVSVIAAMRPRNLKSIEIDPKGENASGLNVLKEADIKAELINFSAWWRGPITPEKRRYREGSQELLADAISAFLIDEQIVQDRAPLFHRAWTNWMENRPRALKAYMSWSERLNKTEPELAEARAQGLKEDFTEGDKRRLVHKSQLEQERGGIGAMVRNYGMWGGFKRALKKVTTGGKTLLHDWTAEAQQEMRDIAKQAGKQGDPNAARAALDAAKNVELIRRRDQVSKELQNEINRLVHQPIAEAGGNANMIGEVLMHMGILTHRKRVTKKGETVWEYEPVANPRAFTETTARQQLDRLRQKWGSEKFDVVLDAVRAMDGIVWREFGNLYDSGVVKPEIYEKAVAKREEDPEYVYAFFVPLRYVNKQVKGVIQEMTGTFSQVDNPYISTYEKASAMAFMAKDNQLRRKVLDGLKVIENSPIRKHIKGEPVEPGMGVIDVYENGKRISYVAPKPITNLFGPRQKLGDSESIDFSMRMFKGLTYGVFYKAFVLQNPAFAARNMFRDWNRTFLLLGPAIKSINKQTRKSLREQGYSAKEAKEIANVQVPNLSFGEVFMEWQRAMPDAVRSALGQHVEEIAELRRQGLLDYTITDLTSSFDDPIAGRAATLDRLTAEGVEAEEYARQEMSALDKAASQFVSAVKKSFNFVDKKALRVQPIKRATQVTPAFIETMETASKLGALRVLQKRVGLTEAEIAYIIHNFVGTPNTKQKGAVSPLLDGMHMFQSIRLAALSSHLQAIKDPGMRYDYMGRQFVSAALQSSLLAAAANWGFGGQVLQRIMGLIGDDDEDRYWIVPMGLVYDEEDGRLKADALYFPKDDSQVMLSRLTRTVAEAARKKDAKLLGKLPGQMWNEVSSGWNPWITMGLEWAAYSNGETVRDKFYGYDVLTRQQIAMGEYDKGIADRNYRKMLGQTSRHFGLYRGVAERVLHLMTQSEPLAVDRRTQMEQDQIYSLGFRRVTDRGLTEEEYEQALAYDAAKMNLERTEAKDDRAIGDMAARVSLYSTKNYKDMDDPMELNRKKIGSIWLNKHFSRFTEEVHELKAEGLDDKAEERTRQFSDLTRHFLRTVNAEDQERYEQEYGDLLEAVGEYYKY